VDEGSNKLFKNKIYSAKKLTHEITITKSRKIFLHSQKQKPRGYAEHKFTDKVLQTILQPLPLLSRYCSELQVYHRWAGAYFHHSAVYSRLMRALPLTTNVIVILFIEAVTYDIADSNDGSCELLNGRDTGLVEMSSLQSSASNYYWDVSAQSCHFKEVKNDIQQGGGGHSCFCCY
jgi:hypothetical protein